MNENNSRNLRYLEEFELVNASNKDVYVEKDVYIQPEVGKNGMIQYKIFDSANKEIGVVDASKKKKKIKNRTKIQIKLKIKN